MQYVIKVQLQNSSVTHNDVPWSGLEANWSDVDPFLSSNEKNHGGASLQYFITIQVKNGDMSLNYAPWVGLEAYSMGVTLAHFC